MKRALAVAALASLGAFAAPVQASGVTVCLGGVTLVAAGTTVVDQDLGCHVVDLPWHP